MISASVLRRIVRRPLVACTALAVALACVAPAIAAPGIDQQAVERGRVMGRVLTWFRAPSMCVIPTLRARCISDFNTFVDKRTDDSFARLKNAGPTPLTRMRHYLAAGDPDDFEPAFITIYGLIAPQGQRSASPLGAWLYDAGAFPELPKRRAQLVAVKPADFSQQYRLAVSLVDYLLANIR